MNRNQPQLEWVSVDPSDIYTYIHTYINSNSSINIHSRRYRRYLRGHHRRPRGSPPVFHIPLSGTPVSAHGRAARYPIALVYVPLDAVPLDAVVTRVTWSLATRSPRDLPRSSTWPETYSMLITILMATDAAGFVSTSPSATTSAA